MNTTRFDLVDITQTLQKRRRFILIITILAVILGCLFFLVRKKKYAAKAQFFINNPLYSDRSTLFGGADGRNMDYFGGEDDVDRVIALSESDTVATQVIKNAGLDVAYKLDMTKPDDLDRLKNIYKSSLDVKRTEYKMMDLTYTDHNAELAAKAAGETVRALEATFRNFYTSKKTNMSAALVEKLHDLDSTINTLTDTLAVLREQSGIYDIISPNRSNMVLSAVKNNGKNAGRNIELIQNVESEKDLAVTEKVRYLTLLGQYNTGIKPDELLMFHIITSPKTPVDPKGPTLPMVLIISAFLGFFFSTLYVLLTTYYRQLILVQR